MGYTQVGSFADLYRIEPWERCMDRIADRCGRRLYDMAVAFTPVAVVDPDDLFSRNRRPGELKAKWVRGEVVLYATGRLSVTVENHDPIAKFVEYPTRPHVIRPRADRPPATILATRRPRGTVHDGRAHLRFRVDGRVVYAREVHHPGTHGAFMMTRALAVLAEDWRQIAREEIDRTTREVGSLR
jgi:hypothetical protein